MLTGSPHGQQIFTIQMVFLLVAWLFVVARAYVKIWIVKKILVADWLMFTAILAYTAFGTFAMYGVTVGGIGSHESTLNSIQLLVSYRSWWFCEIIYVMLSCIIRTSIGLFLLTIATKKIYKVIVWTDMAVVWVSSTAAFFISMTQCRPINYFWMRAVGEDGICEDARIVPYSTVVHSALSAMSDVILALLPVAILWNVRMNKRTKLTIAILLSMGLVAAVALVVRIHYISVETFADDWLYDASNLAMATVLEPGLGIIAGCGATLRPLFKRWGFGTKDTTNNYISSFVRRSPHANSGWQKPGYVQKASNGTKGSGARGGGEVSPGSSQIELTELPHLQSGLPRPEDEV